MSSDAYEIYAYDFDRLKKSIAGDTPKKRSPSLMEKNHFRYLEEYLSGRHGIHARTVIVEKRYVDKDFLEDYAAYYARCFDSYERFCQRIHFFGIDVPQERLDSILRDGGTPEKYRDLADAYLGFIVIRPLPYRVIGRTCLKNYGNRNGVERFFPTVRDYSVNLFGMMLTVSSVAFQEQDREVSACATSALWSAFQVTSVQHNHPAPSPFEITRIATKIAPSASRTFPNGGLTEQQVADAIRYVGLEPVTISVRENEQTGMPTGSQPAFDADKFKALFYAYNRCGIPAIITADLYETDGVKRSFKGFHGVTGLGYRFPKPDEVSTVLAERGPRGLMVKLPEQDKAVTGPKLLGTTISPIFIHDDQAGPFARLLFDNGEVKTSWYSNKNESDDPATEKKWRVIAEPKNLIFPLYHKIRVPFFDAHRVVQEFDAVVTRYRDRGPPQHRDHLKQSLVWDLYLNQAQDIRRSFFESSMLDGALRARMLTTNLPRYIWRATGYLDDRAVVDIFLDATGLSNGTNVFCALPYDNIIIAMADVFIKRLEGDGVKVRKTKEGLFDKAEAVLRNLLEHRPGFAKN